MLLSPEENVGKIVTALEKYYNVKAKKMDTKYRPVLIIGFEKEYKDKYHVDYEVLPISSMGITAPDSDYDTFIQEFERYNLREASYIRTHKTSWINVRQLRLNNYIINLKEKENDDFESLVRLNQRWVNERTELSCLKTSTS
ncbi:MAG: hypothetical protein ABS913_02400 [Desemzia incerta]|uniref:hypothetical protein n=1 Tax=Desemzia incerta TaxID=82801 RepID=UPI0033156974